MTDQTPKPVSVRCPVCRTSGATAHDPDGSECRDMQRERLFKNRD
jgi:hypothetical protein